MSSSYCALFARAGARSLALACGLGWFSFASYGLAVVLAVEAAAGSFAVAGAAVGALSAGSALLAPLRGRFVDRRGPVAVADLAPAHGAALAILVAGCATSQPSWFLVVFAGLAGTVTPPLIATARALWPAVSGPDLTRTGHAVNAALGDAALVAGPAITAALAALTSPALALGVLAAGATAGAAIVARTPGPAAPTGTQTTPRSFWGLLRESGGLRTIAVCEMAIGVSLGALDVAAPAIAAESGAAELGAVPLSAFAVGSLAASLWSGAGRLRRTPGWRYVAGVSALAAVMPLCLVAETLGALSVVLLGAGVTFGLLNVAVFELLEAVVVSDRAVEAFTWLTTSGGVGIAAGAAGAGRLSDRAASDALVLVAFPAVIAAVMAAARRPTLRPTTAKAGPPRDR